MKRFLFFVLAFSLCFGTGCSTKENTQEPSSETQVEKTKDEVIGDLLAEMTNEEKVGQLLMCAFRRNADDTGMTVLSEDAAEQIGRYALGGVILFAENLETTEQTKTLIEDLQKCAEIPPFIGVDEIGRAHV